jgi:hypothetical protein
MGQEMGSLERAGIVEPEPRGVGFSCAAYVAFGSVLLLLYFIASLGTPVCFSDCIDYTLLMGLSGAAYLQMLQEIFRPWAVPTLFSLFGPYSIESASRIVFVQTWLAFFSWVLFAYACRSLLTTQALRIIGFVVLSLLMFGQGYYHLNQYILSDSLALSSVLVQWSLVLLFPAFAAWARARRLPQSVNLYLAAFVAVSAFEMATRDANIMIALAALAFLLWLNVGVRRSAALLIVGLALVQSYSAGRRHHVNADNILAGAVLPNEEMRNYFLDHGMPASFAALGSNIRPRDLDDIDIDELRATLAKIKQLPSTPEEKEFMNKIDSVYARYLVTHPAYVLGNVWRHWPLIFSFAVERDPRRLASNDNAAPLRLGVSPPYLAGGSVDISVADYFPPAVGVALFAGCFALPFLRRDKFAYLPILFALVGAGNAVLSFFGDVWERSEMTRHAAIGSVMLRCGLTLCALMLLDLAPRRAASRSARKRPRSAFFEPIRRDRETRAINQDFGD